MEIEATCYLLAIPFEIRTLILEFLLVHDGALQYHYPRPWPTHPIPIRGQMHFELHPRILQTCKQLGGEGTSMLYNQNTLAIQVYLCNRNDPRFPIFCLGRQLFHDGVGPHAPCSTFADQDRRSAYEKMRRLEVRIECEWALTSSVSSNFLHAVQWNNDILEKLTHHLLNRQAQHHLEEIVKKPMVKELAINVADCKDPRKRRMRDRDLGGPFPKCLQPLHGHLKIRVKTDTMKNVDNFQSNWLRMANLYSASEEHWPHFRQLQPCWQLRSGVYVLRNVYTVIQACDPDALLATRGVAREFVEEALKKIISERAHSLNNVQQQYARVKSCFGTKRTGLNCLGLGRWNKRREHDEREKWLQDHKALDEQLRRWLEFFQKTMMQLDCITSSNHELQEWLSKGIWSLMSLNINNIDFSTPWVQAAQRWQERTRILNA
jgi:hypothetical protein